MEIKSRNNAFSLALVLTAGVALGAAANARAADAAASYPSKPIRIIVPTAPGGGVDTLSRILAQHLTEIWGQQVIVDNRGGASGVIGAELVARTGADGYTLLTTPTTFAINSSVVAKLPYDPRKDFAPVTLLASEPNILVVHPSLPVKSLKELIALAKRNPGALNFGSGSLGSSSHLSGEMFKDRVGVDIVGVPYKGTGPAVTALVAGEVTMMFVGLPPILHYVKNGKLRPLAATSNERSPFLPDVPTMAEAGLPQFEVTNWIGLLAHAKAPAEIVQKLNAGVVRILALPIVRERFAGLGVVPSPTTPGQFRGFLDGEISRWAQVVKKAGIKPQ